VGIKRKNADQIEKMRLAGQVVREVLTRLGEMIAVGVTTEELDSQAERICLEHGAKCLFRGVPGRRGAGPFPGNICCSVNEQVVHGIPGPRTLADGDIVSVDFGVQLDGWCADAAETYILGDPGPDVRRLVEVTRQVMDLAISRMAPGIKWSSIARSMQDLVWSEGFSVVEEFFRHGIGRDMWESPKVPNFVSPELRMRDIRLREGVVLAVEPMVNMGAKNVYVASDGWTVETGDGKPSAHWEQTIAIVDGGVEVLTA